MNFIQGLNAVMPANSQSVVQPQSVPEHNSSFDFNVKDKQVLRFVGYSSKYKEELESLSDDEYKVKVVIKESKITIKVTPLEEEAENQAKEELTEFFSNFSSKVVKLEKDKVNSIKVRHPAILDYEKGGDVYVQERENNNKIDITLSGIKKEVEIKVKQINEAADFETKTERFPHFIYRAIMSCGLYEDVQRLCGEVEINRQDPISSLEYCGPSHKVEEAKHHLKKMVQNLHEETPEFFTEIKSLLAEVLQLEDSKLEENLLQILQSDLKATLSLSDGKLYIIAKSQSIFNQYCDVIKNKIVTCEWAVVNQDLMKLQKMKEIQQFRKLKNNGKLLMVTFGEGNVQITGEKSLVLAWKNKIKSALSQLRQCSHETMLTKHARDFVMNVWDNPVKSKVVIQEIGDQIQVKGMVDDVTMVVKEMKLLEKNLKMKTKVYKKHGCVHYFQSPNAKTMLKSVGTQAKVGISWIKCSEMVQVQPQVSSVQMFGGIEVAAMSGDITKHVCDMVVNSAPTNYKLNAGALSRAIIAAGGQQIAQECLNPIVLVQELPKVTSGGQLQCKYICHLVVPSHQPDLELAVFKILRRGNKLGVSSVAFPSLGTGGRGLSPDMVVTSIVEGILKFSTNYPSSSIRKVDLVHFNQNEVPLSLSIIKSKVPNNPVVETVEFIEVQITGETNGNIRVGEAMLDKLLESKITTEQLHQNDLNQLSHLELNEINSFAETIPDVNITLRVAKQTIDIEGTSEKVKDVKMEVKGYLKSMETATISYKLFQWQYCDNAGRWNNYPKMASYKIEQGVQGSVLSVPTDAGTHFVNKQNKTFQINSTVGKIRKMSTDHKDFPEHWTPMGGQSLMKVILSEQSDEYKRICQLFQASSNGGRIVQIDRIQKPVLYRQYAAMREEVRSHVTAGHLVERELFHGTTSDVSEQILNTGFNRSYAGKNGTMLGNGVYFSTTSSYSDRYAKQTPLSGRKSLTKIMFVASVLTGEYDQGNRDLKEPPIKPGTSHTYDSVVDNVASPTMFAVFKDASAYPSYLISYL
ncbi:protein mono-ADP-ribosyltransferase PARP15-like [Ciona intestinalis]